MSTLNHYYLDVAVFRHRGKLVGFLLLAGGLCGFFTLADASDSYLRGGRIVRPPQLPEALTQPKLEIELDKTSYVSGDTQTVTVHAPRAGYLYVASIWADGNVYVYFPNKDHPSAKVEKDEVIRLPGGDQYKIVMHYPAVTQNTVYEQVLAVLNPVPIDDILVDEENPQTATFQKQGLISSAELAAVRGGRLERPVKLEKVESRLTAAGVYKMSRKN